MDVQPVPLRALALGEIFDRGVTLYVRNFAVFTSIVLTLFVPLSLLEYLVLPNRSETISQIVAQMQHPASSRPSPFFEQQFIALFAVGLLGALLLPFVENAVAVGVASAYEGKRPVYGRSFAIVLRRAGPLVLTLLLCIAMGVGVYIAMLFGMVIVGITGIMLAKVAAAIGIAIIAALVLAIIVAAIAFWTVCTFAFYATSIEAAAPAEAISRSFRRLFGNHEFGKALSVGISCLALQIGAELVVVAIQLGITLVTNNQVIDVVVNALVGSALTALVAVLFAVYYYDVRTRAEGLDLEVELARLTASV
jgi:hypothetical protein